MIEPCGCWYVVLTECQFHRLTDVPQPTLQKLKNRAVAALNSQPSPGLRESPSRMSPSDGVVKEEDDELAALGGKTRLVPRKSPSLPSSPQEIVGTHNSPSPHGSPAQPYSVDTSPTISLAHDVHGLRNGSVHSLPQWQSFQQPHQQQHHMSQSPHSPHVPTGDYANYYAQMPPWSPEVDYGPMQPQSMVMSPTNMTYMPYDQLAPPMQQHGYLPSQSPVDTHSGVQPDPHASWQNLYAQYQSGLPN